MNKKSRLGAGIGSKGLRLTLLTVLFAAFSFAIAQERDESKLPDTEEYVNLPELVVTGKRWRLSEEEQAKLWRRELSELEDLEREQRERKEREGAVASKTSGRWKTEFLPRYNPEKKLDDLGVDAPRSEVVQLFRIGF